MSKDARTRKGGKSPPRTLTLDERERLRSKIGLITCSAAWRDDVTKTAENLGIHPTSHKLAKELHRRGVYPPCDATGPAAGRRPTLMRRCTQCGSRWFPPQYISTGSARMLESRLGRLMERAEWILAAKRKARAGPALLAYLRRFESAVEQIHRVRERISEILHTHLCEDCRVAAGVGRADRPGRERGETFTSESASAGVQLMMEMRGARLNETTSLRVPAVEQRAMPSERPADLLEEIHVWERSGYVIEVYRDADQRRRRVLVKRDEQKVAELAAAGRVRVLDEDGGGKMQKAQQI